MKRKTVSKEEMKVEKFKFQDLEASKSSLKVNKDNIQDFKFENFSQGSSDVSAEMLKIERELSQKSGFKISPIVMEQRGLLAQEKQEREESIQAEVQNKVDEIQSQAYQVAYEEGLKAGLKEATERTKAESEEKLEVLSNTIMSLLKSKNDILETQKKEFMQLIRSLTKWIVLKELEHDDEYLSRLLEKLILESQAKSNICVKVAESDFEKTQDLLVTLQEKIATLSNVRVEINPDIDKNSMILESDNGLVVATLDQQMMALDKIFKPVIEGQV